MTNQLSLTPPQELVDAWEDKYPAHMPEWVVRHVADEAAQWGADQELEACCDWLDERTVPNGSTALRTTRRPKPPSLRKQAYDALDTYIYGEPDPKDKERTYNTIRRALEALPND